MGVSFLSLNEVLLIHSRQIELFGGSTGIRDMGLLQSAIGMPQATYEGRFLFTTLEEMAAAYLFHIVQNHPFVDGNKRVGAVTADVFLQLNGFQLIADKGSLSGMVFSVASGECSREAVARYIEAHIQPITQ